MERKQKRGNKKIIIILLVLVAVITIFLFRKFYVTGKSVNEQVTITPLSASEYAKVKGILETSQFIKDMPNKGVVALRFFKFEDGKRVWQNGFLIGKNALLSSGNPDFYIILHSKYIPELNENNLCEVIGKAKNKGDLGYYSEKSKISLMLKYAGMLKYVKCAGLSL